VSWSETQSGQAAACDRRPVPDPVVGRRGAAGDVLCGGARAAGERPRRADRRPLRPDRRHLDRRDHRTRSRPGDVASADPAVLHRPRSADLPGPQLVTGHEAPAARQVLRRAAARRAHRGARRADLWGEHQAAADHLVQHRRRGRVPVPHPAHANADPGLARTRGRRGDGHGPDLPARDVAGRRPAGRRRDLGEQPGDGGADRGRRPPRHAARGDPSVQRRHHD
jgi:hypothetical protein